MSYVSKETTGHFIYLSNMVLHFEIQNIRWLKLKNATVFGECEMNKRRRKGKRDNEREIFWGRYFLDVLIEQRKRQKHWQSSFLGLQGKEKGLPWWSSGYESALKGKGTPVWHSTENIQHGNRGFIGYNYWSPLRSLHNEKPVHHDKE